MPRPAPDDPLLCPGSYRDGGFEVRIAHDERWYVCPACRRGLKALGLHRVRSKTTASLDKTRDILINITPAQIALATATDPTRSTA